MWRVKSTCPDHLITNWQGQDLNPGLSGLWLPLYTILLSWQITKFTIYSVNKNLLTSPLPAIVAGNTMVSERWILSLELINLMGKRTNQIVTRINRKPQPDLVLEERSVVTKVIHEEEVVTKLINEGWVSVDQIRGNWGKTHPSTSTTCVETLRQKHMKIIIGIKEKACVRKA